MLINMVQAKYQIWNVNHESSISTDPENIDLGLDLFVRHLSFKKK